MRMIVLRILGGDFGCPEGYQTGRMCRRTPFHDQMNHKFESLRSAELDATNFLEWREQMTAFEADMAGIEPRTYPGYPRWPLLRVGLRFWPSLDRALIQRRSANRF